MGRFDNDRSDRRVRRYKVTCYGEDLGAFLLPIGEHLENPEALLRPIVTRPYKDGSGEDATYFWAEVDPAGGFFTVYWRPQTAAQADEAERFYRSARGLRPDGSVDPERQPPLAARSAEEMRLVRAVRAAPDAEQPYLDYADWLDRRSDPYAEYIRLSLRMEPLAEDDEFRERLEDRRDDLVERHGAKWVRGLTDLGLFPGSGDREPDDFDPDWWFGDKGVIERIPVPGGTFVFRTNPARLFAAAPFLRNLTVSDPFVSVADVAAVPQMAQIEWLFLVSGTGTGDDFRRFADTPHFAGLRWLTVYGYGIGPDVAGVLAGARWMAQLRGLCLDANPLGDDGAGALAESPQCANLEELELNGTGLTDRGLIGLCRSPHLARVHTLELANNAFSAEGMQALGSATFGPRLHYLDLPHCGFDGSALEALAGGTFPALRVLDVSGHAVGDDALRALVAAPFFRALEVFWADDCGLGTGIVEAIAGLGFIGLEDLSLSDNRLGPRAAAVLVRSKAATRLQILHLARNPLGTAGVLELAGADLPRLRHLDLLGIRLGKEEVLALVKAPWRKQLTQLDLSEDCVGERGAELLIERFGEDVVTFDE
jgi:uncharacterized protein (TIGR02996 family)